MLSTNDLTWMRDSNEMLFPDTCSILSASGTADGYGGVIETWGTASASVACRVDFINGVVQLSGGGLQTFSRMTIAVPYDTTMTEDNRIVWNGGTYSVTGVQSDSWMTLKQAELHNV